MTKRALRGPPRAVLWRGGVRGRLSLLEQTLLPEKCLRVEIEDVETLWGAIRRLVVRGAPAIGVAAAYGAVLGAREALVRGGDVGAREVAASVLRAIERLATSRPTAVNLFWALDRMRRRLECLLAGPRLPSGEALARGLLAEAKAIHREDAELCRSIGTHGAGLLRDGWTILTHCNAGALATGGSGTALSPVYEACRAGKRICVIADETRPLLQGARLTAWELHRAGVPVTLICDGMAASVFASGRSDCVIVGADRIARNGDVANKIGTYGVAVLARAHGVPFYVAAPSTTFDAGLSNGAGIPIEMRSPLEVTEGFGRPTAPRGIEVYNPAFDVTPARLVTGIITERGVIRATMAAVGGLLRSLAT
jgi:methylthioribose-1-phosphate isomerase